MGLNRAPIEILTFIFSPVQVKPPNIYTLATIFFTEGKIVFVLRRQPGILESYNQTKVESAANGMTNCAAVVPNSWKMAYCFFGGNTDSGNGGSFLSSLHSGLSSVEEW